MCREISDFPTRVKGAFRCLLLFLPILFLTRLFLGSLPNDPRLDERKDKLGYVAKLDFHELIIFMAIHLKNVYYLTCLNSKQRSFMRALDLSEETAGFIQRLPRDPNSVTLTVAYGDFFIS